MTQEEAKAAILVQWQRLPAWKRKTSQDAIEFAHTMIISRPDLTDFECSLDRFLVLRAWVTAEQRSAEPPYQPSKRTKARAARGKTLLKSVNAGAGSAGGMLGQRNFLEN